ncbi:MAG: sulfoacetaldehyde acetyltransferase, partial [Desulfobacterales bacterium]|nr:sulfoacetaldehyde acetyltransferase [Desulfobacterales bacterium]
FRVDHPDQVGDVMKEAIASGKPCVINAIVQGGEEVLAEPFRRDALNMPVRYLDKYAHLNAK